MSERIGWMDGWMHGWIGWMNCMDGWMDQWMDGMDGWMAGTLFIPSDNYLSFYYIRYLNKRM